MEWDWQQQTMRIGVARTARVLLIQIILVTLSAQRLSHTEFAARFVPPLAANRFMQVLPESRPRLADRLEPSQSSGDAIQVPETQYRCTTCEEFKAAAAFSASWLRKKSKICRECKAGYNRRWYKRNKQEHVADVRRNSARYKRRNNALLLQLKRQPCVDCGLTLHPMAMEFDHVRGSKEWEISELNRRLCSVKRLLDEVAKCDLVCANCHRIRTAHRLQASGKRVYWASEEVVAEESSR